MKHPHFFQSARYYHPTFQIISNNNSPIQVHFTPETDPDDGDTYFIMKDTAENRIGYIKLTLLPEKKLIYINLMENEHREKGTKHVGRLLHHFVAFFASKHGLKGFSVMLSATLESAAFHAKCGFTQTAQKNTFIMDKATFSEKMALFSEKAPATNTTNASTSSLPNCC